MNEPNFISKTIGLNNDGVKIFNQIVTAEYQFIYLF